jgi:hypothetical protein
VSQLNQWVEKTDDKERSALFRGLKVKLFFEISGGAITVPTLL